MLQNTSVRLLLPSQPNKHRWNFCWNFWETAKSNKYLLYFFFCQKDNSKENLSTKILKCNSKSFIQAIILPIMSLVVAVFGKIPLIHYSLVLHFIWKPDIWFALQTNPTLGWNGLRYLKEAKKNERHSLLVFESATKKIKILKKSS